MPHTSWCFNSFLCHQTVWAWESRLTNEITQFLISKWGKLGSPLRVLRKHEHIPNQYQTKRLCLNRIILMKRLILSHFLPSALFQLSRILSQSRSFLMAYVCTTAPLVPRSLRYKSNFVWTSEDTWGMFYKTNFKCVLIQLSIPGVALSAVQNATAMRTLFVPEQEMPMWWQTFF